MKNGEIEIAEKIYKVLNNTETVELIDPVLKTKKLYTFDDDVLYPSDEVKKADVKDIQLFMDLVLIINMVLLIKNMEFILHLWLKIIRADFL